MARLIAPPSENDAELIPAGTADVPLTYFRLLKFESDETVTIEVPGFELIAVVMSGQCQITVGTEEFGLIGGRTSVWDGDADSVYAGTGQSVTLRGNGEAAEIAIAGGACSEDFSAFRIRPDAVESVEVGSVETHTQRSIHHILGQNANGRAGNLLVSELYAAPGCWSGYPPHKHDVDNLPEESAFEEVYHYRFDPPQGFGGQYHYYEGENPSCEMTTDRSTFVVDAGYHPTSTAPGYRGYIFTILVGKSQRSLIQYFEEPHRHLFDVIPGLAAMRDKFR